jgi:hypothetical protein
MNATENGDAPLPRLAERHHLLRLDAPIVLTRRKHVIGCDDDGGPGVPLLVVLGGKAADLVRALTH